MIIKFNDLYTANKRVEKKIIKSFSKHIKYSNFIGGTSINKFENYFKKINQSKFCISCANGSDAVVIALKALGIRQGEEVITTSLSWIATSAAVTLAGGNVVFCDIEKDGFNIDYKSVEKKITKKTVGIIPVHLYGNPANMVEIMKIAKKNKLWVIEDCAQAHQATIKKKKVGNFGSFGTFSFFPGKNLGALGDAGCLVTNNKSLARKARLIANHGGKGKHLLEGINSRLDSVQASFLNIKIEYLKIDTQKRIKNAENYLEKLKTLSQIKLPHIKNEFNSVYHQFVIKLKNRNELSEYLKKNKIETQIHYKKILPLMGAYKYMNLNSKDFPNSYVATKEILCLPISPSIDKKKINFICNKIQNFFKKK